MTKLIEKPKQPKGAECCESGRCQPCVWDVYHESMRNWRIQQTEIKEEEEKSSST